MKKHIFSICLIFIFTSILFSQPDITPRLSEEINQSLEDDSFIKTVITLKDQFDVLKLDQELYRVKATPQERSKKVVESLQEKAITSQEDILKYLHSLPENDAKNIKPFWIVNMISLEAKANVLLTLAESENIAQMDIDGKIVLESAKKEKLSVAKTPGTAEPGLRVINAHRLWQLGYTGAGRIVMNIDTGVDALHPALGWRWRGNHVPDSLAWFDPVNSTNYPSDADGHGTATMGIACGLDSITNDTIGVSFGTEWIASNSLWGNPHTSYTIAAFQWAMDPDGNPSTISDMPDAINCSWYDPAVGYCDSTYAMVFNAVEAAGIAIVFHAGARGPSSQSIVQPANVNTNEVNTWATGVIDGNTSGFPLYSPSGRGPSQCTTGISSLDIKPEACAPGVSIRTSVTNNSYHVFSGSSMATAHVTGAIALLKEAFPNLTGQEIKMALYNSAIDLGTPGEDNLYGKGLIDVYAAFQYLGPSSLGEINNFIPLKYALHQNFPNPFNPSTTIKYDLKATTDVKLTIYNVLGQKVRTLVNTNQAAGFENIVWNGLNDYGEQVSTGLYIYRIEAGNPSAGSGQGFVKSRKMVFLK